MPVVLDSRDPGFAADFETLLGSKRESKRVVAEASSPRQVIEVGASDDLIHPLVIQVPIAVTQDVAETCHVCQTSGQIVIDQAVFGQEIKAGGIICRH